MQYVSCSITQCEGKYERFNSDTLSRMHCSTVRPRDRCFSCFTFSSFTLWYSIQDLMDRLLSTTSSISLDRYTRWLCPLSTPGCLTRGVVRRKSDPVNTSVNKGGLIQTCEVRRVRAIRCRSKDPRHIPLSPVAT